MKIKKYFSNFYKYKYSNKKMLNLLLSASADLQQFSDYIKKFFSKNKILFKKGLHEDILFMFKTFFCKSKYHIKDYIYRKNNYQKSIINNISKVRISNYLNAFQEIKYFSKT